TRSLRDWSSDVCSSDLFENHAASPSARGAALLMASKSEVLGSRTARLSDLVAAIAALPRWSILLLAAVAVRAITFGNPVVHVDRSEERRVGEGGGTLVD